MGGNRRFERARTRLRKMEERGAILEWDYVCGEDVFFATIPTGQEIEMDATQAKFFNLGYVIGRVQYEGLDIKELIDAVRGVKLSEEYCEDHPKDGDNG